jgi:hypothetical protein
MTTTFNATIEFIGGQRAAIVELTDGRGEWAGGSRIEVRSGRRAELYEQGYIHAARAAAAKGGSLETYRVAP